MRTILGMDFRLRRIRHLSGRVCNLNPGMSSTAFGGEVILPPGSLCPDRGSAASGDAAYRPEEIRSDYSFEHQRVRLSG